VAFSPGKTQRLGPNEPKNVTDRYASPSRCGAKPDPITVALQAGLEAAIAEGRTLDAAQIATELAARALVVSDHKVFPFAPKRRR
jgi:hypothetical protein